MSPVVVDTNIFVAALFGGGSARLVDLWLSGGLTFCVSQPILDEYFHILRSFRFRKERFERVREALGSLENCLYAPTPAEGRWVADDPSDDKFIACALALGARHIVSNDIHLKRLGSVDGIRIVTPGELVKDLR